jgi:beta-glucosidase/6-phospho-beta-glucosidase/beta-galactosidase
MGWPITPDALPAFLRRIHDDYGPPEILVTENGASYSDGPEADGAVHDRRRIDYLAAHVAAVDAARDDGVPVTGYFCGRCSTTSSGPSGSPSDSGSCGSTSPRVAGCPRTPSSGTAG